jgi:hypothetical protein
VEQKGLNKWGPVIVERRSKRYVEDGRTILEKAQEVKRKWLDVAAGGKTKQKPIHVNFNDLSSSASVIGIVDKDGYPVSDRVIREIEELESRRSKTYSDGCEHDFCVLRKDQARNVNRRSFL